MRRKKERKQTSLERHDLLALRSGPEMNAVRALGHGVAEGLISPVEAELEGRVERNDRRHE